MISRYTNVPSIDFELENGYKVKAEYIFNKESGKYLVSLHIGLLSVGTLDQIDQATDIVFDSSRETIKTDIAKYFTKLLIDGFFRYYMDRYEYHMKCFDRGNDLFERERLDAQ